MMGRKLVKIYSRPQMPMGTIVLIPTVVLILNSELVSPMKNKNRETWRQPGTASASTGMYHPWHPSYKYWRSRALLRGSLYRLKTCMYSRTHFWTRIARSAATRLKASAMNQNAFTRTSGADGLNAGKGAGGVDGMETCGAMEASCTEI